MADKPEVLMVAPMFPAAMEAVERDFTAHKLWLAPDRDALVREVAPRVRGMTTTGMVGAKAALIEALPKLEIIACFGVGYDAIDVAAARRMGVVVTNTPEVLTDCVADLAMALLLASARRICEAERYVRAGKWLQGHFPLSTKVGGKVCGIVGMGRIGQAVAKRAEAFGMKIAYYGPRKKGVPWPYHADLVDLAKAADFLVVTAPGGDDTLHLVDDTVLSALGPTGTLVNVARGSVVDEPALIRALQDQRLGAAALDVFEHEPRIPDALLAMENVVLLPHLGSATRETRGAMGQLVVDNLRAHFAGKPVPTPVPECV
ncbi:MAG TPA: 2-hydroxyacid dehydrogenase [Pelomicrobium sp.]|nr:2-hydroxyacid dehydrogenase [Pelomicrobium sp.]